MKLDEILGEKSVSENQLLIGEILVRRGQVRRYQLEFLLTLQNSYRKLSNKNVPIGELLIKHRALVQNSLREALNIQKELPAESVTQIVSQLDLEDEGEETKLL